MPRGDRRSYLSASLKFFVLLLRKVHLRRYGRDFARRRARSFIRNGRSNLKLLHRFKIAGEVARAATWAADCLCKIERLSYEPHTAAFPMVRFLRPTCRLAQLGVEPAAEDSQAQMRLSFLSCQATCKGPFVQMECRAASSLGALPAAIVIACPCGCIRRPQSLWTSSPKENATASVAWEPFKMEEAIKKPAWGESSSQKER